MQKSAIFTQENLLSNSPVLARLVFCQCTYTNAWSDRQLALINSLLEAHTAETQGVILHCEPTQLKPLVDSVLINLNHNLTKKRIQPIDCITDDLPIVNADINQLWRVFSNPIENAIKHNPHEIQLTLERIFNLNFVRLFGKQSIL